MKKLKIFILTIIALSVAGCKDDFLEVPPPDRMIDDPSFWRNEDNVRTFAYGFYPIYFTGYGSGNTFGNYFNGDVLNDDFAPAAPAQFTRVVPTASTVTPVAGVTPTWSFAYVRKANIFINRVATVPMSEEAINHWTGIGRFFRALEYFDLVRRYGDVPWYDKELSELDTEDLYKPRDPRNFVMDNVLADLQFASENVRETDGAAGVTVTKNVVLAIMSRIMLFEGTWEKYHLGNFAKAKEYLEAAKWAADQIIAKNKYTLGVYREVFNSMTLATNPEVILYRQYETGIVMHALNSYNNKEPQSGPSKDAIESYLASDGLPIKLSPAYKGDKGITNIMASRDPRITQTFVSTEFRLNGVNTNQSSSGIATHKFLNETIKDDPSGSNALNPTDAPVFRYGEVLINYAEATAELATIGGTALEQADLDKSVNVLRSRVQILMPKLQVVGGEPAVNNIVYDDPERDPTVPNMIWEIRRERRIELMMEGFRNDDLRRWRKLEYADTKANVDINRGVWIKKSEHPKLSASVVLTGGAEGYIIPAPAEASQRVFTDPKVYLSPIPLDQITLYGNQGVELSQNPGWN